MNHDQAGGYRGLADEAWSQSGGKVDAFVHAVGTCGSLRGTSTALRAHNPKLHVAALRVAKRLGPDATVLAIACDHGLKYISTELYR